jgi:heme-degrading monooxygenase HmoA
MVLMLPNGKGDGTGKLFTRDFAGELTDAWICWIALPLVGAIHQLKGVLTMIARIWRGETPESKADQYFDFLKVTGIKDYRETKGNQGVLVLRRIREGRAEFFLLTLWESWDAIRQFAGDDVEKAFYYPEDPEYLLTMEPEVKHYEVLLPLERK